MPSTVEQLSPTRVKITVEVPFAELKPSMDKAYADIARQVNIPGFRKGKVPPMVIDQRFGRGVVIEQAFNDSWMRYYSAAVVENQLSPLAQPDLEVTKLEDGDLIEFTAEVDVRPAFDLPDFAGVAVTVDAVEVADADVDAQIETLRQRHASRTTVERAAQDGDVVTINLVATKDGESLDDATAEGLEHTIGSGQMIDGLDAAVTGLSAGESNTFESTLVGGALKDELVDVEVTVTAVAEQELPELDDDFAQQASEFDTFDELRANVAERLTAMGRLDQAGAARDAVLESVIESLDIAVPQNILDSELDARRQQITGQLGQAQLSLEEYLNESEDGQSEDEFWADVEKRSTQALKAQMVLDKVAEDHQVQVDQNDLTQHILRKAQQEQVPPQQVADHLKEHPHHIDEYMTEIRRGKALAVVVESATITDSAGAPVEMSRLREDGSLASDEERAAPQFAMEEVDESELEGELDESTDAAEASEASDESAEPAKA